MSSKNVPANVTGAEGAHEVDCADCGWHGSGNDLASGEDDGHGKRAVCPKCGADEEELSFAGLSHSAAMAAEAAKPFGWAQPKGGNYFTRNESSAKRIGGLVPVYADPQPAQADAPEYKSCPHAGVHLYCMSCPVSPCPIGLGEKK